MASGNAEGFQDWKRTPEVILDFEYVKGLLYIVVGNIGTSPAYSVSVEFDEKITGIGGEKEISSLNLFRDIGFLPPQKKIRVFVDSFPSYIARKQPMNVEVTITYYGEDKKKLSNSITHNLSIYQDLPEAM